MTSSRIQFSIRSVLGAMLVVAIGLGLLFSERAREQRAVYELQRLEATIRYSDSDTPGVPKGRVVGVVIAKVLVSAEDLRPLGAFRYLESLEIAYTEVSAYDLKVIFSCLDNLKVLRLQGLRAAGTRFTWLSKCRRLEILSFTHSDVTDDDVVELSKFGHLRELSLEGTKTTDVGVAALASLVHLEKLVLASTAVSDGCIPTITGMKRLTWIDVFSTQVTPDGVSQLISIGPQLTVCP